MKSKVYYFILLFVFSTASAWAKNACYCEPIPESKTYQGEARKRHVIGYSIDWTCSYKCKLNSDQDDAHAPIVKGSYHEYYLRSEIGTEGICEGMVYKPQFNAMLNEEVYMYFGETFGFMPSKSGSEDLKKWALANDCD